MITRTHDISIHRSIRINIFLWTIVLIVLTFASCKPDVDPANANEREEKIYMNDYKPNPFKWGYINASGHMQIPAIYDDNRDFSDGLAAVNLNGKWGFIDKKANLTIPTIYRTAYEFSDGLAIVQSFDREYIILDKSGSVRSKAYYDEQHPFHSDRSKIKLNGLFGYVNKDGIRLDTLDYFEASNFNNGRAIVKTIYGYQIIDHQLKPIFEASFDKIYPTDGNYWRCRIGKNFIYLDITTGEKLWNQTFDKAGDIRDGYACVEQLDKSYILDASDGSLLEVPYSNIRNLSSQRIAYQDKGKYGIIDTYGNVLAYPIFNALYEYRNRRIAYQQGDMWGYLNYEGKEMTPPVYPLVWDFHDGLARVINENGVGFIDTLGRQIIPFQFVEVRDFFEELARVQVFEK